MRPEFIAFLEAVSRHATPLLVYPRHKAEIDGWLTGGTEVLVETPINRFAITADHVICEIENLAKQKDIVTLAGGTHTSPIDISDWKVIDRDKRLDICILQVPEAFAAESANLAFLSIDFTAESCVMENDKILIIGFPQEHRNASGIVINARMLPIVDFVRSVSELRFVVADPDNEREVLINPSGLATPMHMGGASGAPAFRITSDHKYELIGIFTGGLDGINGAYLCTHIKFLTNTGQIDSLQLPPY